MRPINYEYSKNYIDSLFGYKTESQLLNMIKNKFGNETEVQINKENVIIRFNTYEIGKYFKLEPLIVKEIRNYYRNKDMQLKRIIVDIFNTKDDYLANVNPVKHLQYEMDSSGFYIRRCTRKDGKVEESKRERI